MAATAMRPIVAAKMNLFLIEQPDTGNCDYIRQAYGRVTLKFGADATALPLGFTLSGNFKSVPGNDLEEQPNVSPTAVEGLGRSTTAQSTFQVNANPNGTRSDDRVNQVVLRVTKDFDLGNARLNLSGELYNAFNARPVQGTVEDLGPRYLSPFFCVSTGIDRVQARV